MHEEAFNWLEERISHFSSNATYVAGSTAAVLGTFSVSSWAAATGALVAIATFFLNWYYKAKAEKREEMRYRWGIKNT